MTVSPRVWLAYGFVSAFLGAVSIALIVLFLYAAEHGYVVLVSVNSNGEFWPELVFAFFLLALALWGAVYAANRYVRPTSRSTPEPIREWGLKP